MPVFSAHIVVLQHVLSPLTIYVDMDTFFQATGETISALNFETGLRRWRNIPLTLKIVAANSNDMEIKYDTVIVKSQIITSI